jgi:hypothetical protein
MQNSNSHLAGLALCFIASLSSGCASTSARQEQQQPAWNWKPLFDGKSLDGWTPKIAGYPAGQDPLQTFRVTNGVLSVSYDRYGGKFQGRFGYLFYRQPFKAYRLSLDFRFVGGQITDDPPSEFSVSSGVMFNSEGAEEMTLSQAAPISIQAQLLGVNPGGKPRTQGNACGWGVDLIGGSKRLAHCIDSSAMVAPNGTWIHLNLEVTGERIIEYIDGQPTVWFDRSALDATGADTRLPTKELITSRGGKLDLDGGYIALQSAGHPIEFRNIRILPLE